MRDRLRRPTPRTLLARAAAIYAARFGRADGRVRATFEVIFLTGWAPAPDQPQPLRPGSAAARLADALGAVERPAGEPATPNETGKAMKPTRDLTPRRGPPRPRPARPPAGAAGARRRHPRQPRHPRRHRLLVDAPLPPRVPVRPPRHRLPGLEVAAAAASRHPQPAPVHLRRQLPPDLGHRGRRQPAPGHHPRPDRGGGGPPRRPLRRPRPRRLRHALRQPLDALGDRAAPRGGLRAPALLPALPAVFRHHHRHRQRRGLPRADDPALAAGDPHRAGLLRPPALHRGAGPLGRDRLRRPRPPPRRARHQLPRHARALPAPRATPTSATARSRPACSATASASPRTR